MDKYFFKISLYSMLILLPTIIVTCGVYYYYYYYAIIYFLGNVYIITFG